MAQLNPVGTLIDDSTVDHLNIMNIGVNSHAAIDTHIADATLHFTEASIDHLNIQNIGVNSHAAIDTHIADSAIHFLEASIDHTAITNIGVNSHAVIDSHIADATIHFTEGSIDHANILNIGVNTHAQIDTHITDTDIHFSDAPNDGENYVRNSLAWTVLPPAVTGLGIWRYRTETGTPPSSGQIRFDNADISLATEFYLHETNDNSSDVSVFMDLLMTAGSVVYIQDQTDATKYGLIELGTSVDNGSYRTFQIAAILEGGGGEPSQNTKVAIVASSGASSPGVTDHGALTGLVPDDDHTQYALLAGRAGGQDFNGGTAAGDILDITGSSSSPDVGIVRVNSPVTFTYDTFSNTTPAQQFLMNWAPSVTASGAYIGGCLQTAAVFDVTSGVFIPAIFSDTNRYNIGAAPGFSAITFINELSTVANNGNFNLPTALVMNVGLTHERNTAGTSTTGGVTGLSFSPQTRTNAVGAIMTKTEQVAVRVSPTYSTTGFSTVNLGTIIGVNCFQPVVALFQPAAGAENMTAYHGINFPNMTFGGASAVYNVLNSALAAGTNKRVINATGSAQSDFGGQINFTADLVGVNYGAGGDWQEAWAGAGFKYEQALTGGQFRKSFPTSTRMLFDWAVDTELNVNAALGFSLGAQLGANGNQFGNFVAGAQTVTVGGEYSQFLLTQAGNITVDAALSGAFGWTINAPSFTAGTGSLTTAAALNVGGNPNLAATNRIGVRIISNPSGGAGVNAALWVTAGRSKFDGVVDINAPIALGGGAAATLGTIGGSGPTTAAQQEWVQIEVNGNVRWIAAWS